MTTTRTFSTSFALLFALACDASEAPPETATLRSTPPSSQLQDTHCAAKRQVAFVNVSVCPTVTGWTGNLAFPNAGGELAKFCKYDWTGSGTPNVAALQNASGIVSVASDCGAVFDHTDTDVVWDEVGPDVTAAFHNGIGLATADDLALETSEESRSKVYVAVVDTVPEPRPQNPRSLHGEFMVSLIEDIACPAGTQDCAVEVVRFLGLPRYVDQNGVMDLVDTTRGGHYGTQRDVAQGIHNALEAWLATDPDENPSKLIITLAVGWDREVFGDVNDPGPRPSVAAVYAAIQRARCYDAIVLAAAGNRGYNCITGAVAPAAWEQQTMPTASRCAALDAPTPQAGLGYAPLLYSVGGLDHEDGKMANSRVQGMPRLAALATNAVTGNARRTVTGTSAAVGVAAGAAALAWSFNPDLAPSGLMSILYQSGRDTGMDANYALPNTQNLDVHAIDVCAAVEAVCNLSGADCPAVPFDDPLACLEREEVDLSDVFIALDNAEPDSVPMTNVSEVEDCDNECTAHGADMYVVNNSVPTECPEPTSIARPYALPQPTEIGCPNCTLDVTNAIVYATIDPDLEAVQDDLTDVTIAVVDDELHSTYFRYGDLDLEVGVITSIQLPQIKMPQVVRSASITLTFEGMVPFVDPLLLGL